MKTIYLSARSMTGAEAAHKYLKKKLRFLPDYYGMNLDALSECLREDLDTPTRIELPRAVTDEEHLGAYGQRMIDVFQDAAQENMNLKLVLKGTASDQT